MIGAKDKIYGKIKNWIALYTNIRNVTYFYETLYCFINQFVFQFLQVANKDVDMAIGGDQGGSIRIPAAACGIVGLKPTFGLVPYTGIMSIEATIDHTGPMARTVYDTALLLEVIWHYNHKPNKQWNSY